jgi:hypothetical protein
VTHQLEVEKFQQQDAGKNFDRDYMEQQDFGQSPEHENPIRGFLCHAIAPLLHG